MSKYLLHWKTADAWLQKAKVKDPGLVKALAALQNASLREDEYEKRMVFFAEIAKHATALTKEKAIVALGPKPLQLFKDTAQVAIDGRKKAEIAKREADRTGLCRVHLQIMINNWNNKPFGPGYAGYVEVRSPGVDVVRAADVLTGNGLDIHDLRLRPTGTLYLIIRRRMENKEVYVSGTTKYSFDPGKREMVMIFEATQHHKKMTLRAKTTEEVTEKLGLQGTVGVEWKVLKIGGEVTKETEYKKGYEQEVEWEVEYGIDSFVSFKPA